MNGNEIQNAPVAPYLDILIYTATTIDSSYRINCSVIVISKASAFFIVGATALFSLSFHSIMYEQLAAYGPWLSMAFQRMPLLFLLLLLFVLFILRCIYVCICVCVGEKEYMAI